MYDYTHAHVYLLRLVLSVFYSVELVLGKRNTDVTQLHTVSASSLQRCHLT